MLKKWFRKTNGFYNNSNVIRIECEGERQKYSKYIFRVFRFLSPTKLNRNELAGYSEAHSIQPLCKRGVGLLPYSAFEASKVRDGRLEPVQHYSYYKDIR